MVTFEQTRSKFEDIIRKNLNISNPALLKSGSLGIITDFLANIKYDTIQYYNKVFRELNIGLAQDFGSLLFHSSIYNTDIQLATPATFNINIVIPEIDISNIKYQKFRIHKNFEFKDSSGNDYLIPDEIEIIISKTKIQAFKYTSIDKKELTITRAPDPVNQGKFIYLVNYDNCLQVTRLFRKVIVPYYEIGNTFNISENIKDYRGLVEINAWWNNTGESANIEKLKLTDSDFISSIFNYEKFNIKYYQFGSSKYDLDLFLKIYKNNLLFTSGNGIHGKYLPQNTEVILEIKTTLGEYGNLPNMSFVLENIDTEIILDNESSRLFQSNLDGVSMIGGTGGKNVADIEELRQNIFDKISFRNSLISTNDFETFFKYNGFRPFVDSKFLDAKSYIFIFNALIDKNTNNVIDTISKNIDELIIAQKPLFPEINYNGKTMISPFYYKFLSTNETEAYIINPRIPIPLTQNDYEKVSSKKEVNEIVNHIGLELRYDFNRRKSYFTLAFGSDPDKTYKITTNNFSFQLDYANNFTWEVNTLFTDQYCIVKEPMENFKVKVIDRNSQTLATYSSFGTYYQLIYKQTMYKDYEPATEAELDSASQINTDDIADAYLDNELRHLLIEADTILAPTSKAEVANIIRMPFIDKDYFMNSNWDEMYQMLDSFFNISSAREYLPFNVRVVQAFYNTMHIEDLYTKYIFKENNNLLVNNPELKIEAEVTIDKELFIISNAFKNIQDLILSLKIDFLAFFKQKIGFSVKYFESELETYIYEKYNINNSNLNYLKNIEIISPKMFIVNDSDTIYYKMKNDDMELRQIIDFCPPFFHYDLNNIKINIKY